jgi:hypothetical protein
LYVNNGNNASPSTGTFGGSGTRIVLWPGGVSSCPFAFGIDTASMWYGIDADTSYHRWFGGTTEMMYLTNSNLSVIGNITAYASDARLKDNVVPLGDTVLDRVKKMQGYTFTWKEGVDGLSMNGQDLGLLAQEVEEAGFSEAIALAPFDTQNGVSKSGLEYKTIHYNKLHAVWASSINVLVDRVELMEQTILQQSTTILEQEHHIQTQDQKILELEERLARLEKLLIQ